MSRYRLHTTARGIQVRSGFEAKVLANLDARGVPYEYEPYSYNWFERLPRARCACGEGECYVERWYTPDVYLHGDFNRTADRFVEVKGKFTAKDRKIALGVREVHPGVEIRFLLQRDNRINKTSDTRYSDWLRKEGFAYAVGAHIPDNWLS